jgi:hypothetical protein
MATSPATDYEAAREDIEETLGIVPGWLDGLPPADLVHEWPLNNISSASGRYHRSIGN